MHIILLICCRYLKMNSRASKTLTFAGLICAMVLLYCIYHISKFNSINPRDINHIAAEAGDLQNDTGDET